MSAGERAGWTELPGIVPVRIEVAMIPKNEDDDLLEGLEEETEPSLTFAMNKAENTIRGNCDGLNAVKQTIHCILNTERYQCPAFDWDYGVEFSDLVGMPLDYCIAEIERRIPEALLMDDRIEAVRDFVFKESEADTLDVTFIVDTIFGTTEEDTEVKI